MDNQATYQRLGFAPESLSESDIALIKLIRHIRFGTIERLSISKGEVAVITSSTQRIELSNTREREAILMGSLDSLASLDPVRAAATLREGASEEPIDPEL